MRDHFNFINDMITVAANMLISKVKISRRTIDFHRLYYEKIDSRLKKSNINISVRYSSKEEK